MTMTTSQRRSRLLERTWESFVGFSDKAVEEQFLAYEVQRRKTLLCGYTILYVLGIFTKVLHRAITGTLSAADLLLHPTVPINNLISVIAFALGRWRWVEPLAIATFAVRTVGELLWLTPNISLECLQSWDTFFATPATCTVWLLANAVGNFATHVRFKVAFWVLMFHVASVPFIVNKASAELSTFGLVLFFFCVIGVRLWHDTTCRAEFLRLHSAPSAKVASEEATCSCDLTDQALEELIHQVTQGVRSTAAVATQHTVFLRIPEADPSDMGPGAKTKLKHEFEARFPRYVVTDITFQRGSLLVGMSISCPGEAGDADASTECLKRVSHSTWLTWLGLPADMDMSFKVDIPAERRVSWLDGFPLAVAVRKSEQGFASLAFPLRCAQCPQDVAFKASFGDSILECHVLVTSSDEGEVEDNRSPGAKQSCITLHIELPANIMCASPCCLLMVNVQSTMDHCIIGARTVVLLLNDLTDMECDLSSMRLLRANDMSLGHKIHSQEKPDGGHLAYGVGWWLQTMHVGHQHGGSGEEGGAAASRQLHGMWRSGNYLLLDLVSNGCTAAAKHVVHVLLTSKVLRPFVHGRETRGGPDGAGTFLDYFEGAINPRASSILHLAVLNGCCAMVDEVLRWIQVYNLPCLWGVKDQFGMTPLHLAALVNEGNMASFLLRKGDPVLLHAWHDSIEGRVGSPEQFSKRIARLSTGAGGMVDHQGRRRTGLAAPAWQRGIPTLRSRLSAPTPLQLARALPTVRVPAHEPGREDPACKGILDQGSAGGPDGSAFPYTGAPGSGHVSAHPPPLDGSPVMLACAESVREFGTIGSSKRPLVPNSLTERILAVSANRAAHPPPLDGPPAKLAYAESTLAVSANRLGIALLPKLSSRVSQLWSCLGPLPDPEQEKRFNLYKIENNSTIISTLCLFQIAAVMSLALKGGGTFLLLQSTLLLCSCNILLLHAIYKRDYVAAEVHLIGWMFFRIYLSGSAADISSNIAQLWRPCRSIGEPIRFTWAMAENLGALVITCVVCKEAPVHWIFLSHFMGLITTVALHVRNRSQFLALEKSQ